MCCLYKVVKTCLWLEEVLRIYLSGSGRKPLTCLSVYEVQKFGVRFSNSDWVFLIRSEFFFKFGVMLLNSKWDFGIWSEVQEFGVRFLNSEWGFWIWSEVFIRAKEFVWPPPLCKSVVTLELAFVNFILICTLDNGVMKSLKCREIISLSFTCLCITKSLLTI